eukprot:11501472-Alexandrium_andersonii.AAC.1
MCIRDSPPCGHNTEHQAVILCRLKRNPAVQKLIRTTDSGQRLYRNEPTLREQFTRAGAITEVMHAAVRQAEAEPR